MSSANDALLEKLQRNRPWYIGFGLLLIVFGMILFGSLSFASLIAIYIFGGFMMAAGVVHFIAAFKFFTGGKMLLWGMLGIVYALAGYFALVSPMSAAVLLTNFLAITMIFFGAFKTISALAYRDQSGWGWMIFSGALSLITGIVIIATPSAPFWILGLFLATDMIFQGINYLALSGAAKKLQKQKR